MRAGEAIQLICVHLSMCLLLYTFCMLNGCISSIFSFLFLSARREPPKAETSERGGGRCKETTIYVYGPNVSVYVA